MAVLGVHPRPQADRGDVSLDDDLLLPGRRRVRPAAAAGAALPPSKIFQQPHLQRLLHPPRGDDDLSLHHPGDPLGAGELLHPSPHRGPRRRLPPPEPCELLGLRRRVPRGHRLAGGADGHRLDLLHPVLGEVRRRRDDPLPRDLPHRHVVDPHGAQFHRHDPQVARPGDDVAPAPALHLGDVRHEHHSGDRHPGGRGDVPAAGRRAHFRGGVLRPGQGGDPVLFQHFFWFYSHPVVYVMILPAMGIVSEVIPVFSRKPIFGYKAIAYSSVAIALGGFLVCGAPHVHFGDVPAGEHDLLAHDLLRRRPHGGEGLQLDRHALPRVDHLRGADALRPDLHLPVHRRRAHRAVSRGPWPPTCSYTTPTSSWPTSTTR